MPLWMDEPGEVDFEGNKTYIFFACYFHVCEYLRIFFKKHAIAL